MSQGVSLSVDPTSGPAPLSVTATVTITTDVPFQGYVGVIIVDTSIKHKPPSSFDFRTVSIDPGDTQVVFNPVFPNVGSPGGISGHVYSFQAILENESFYPVTQSDVITVTVQ